MESTPSSPIHQLSRSLSLSHTWWRLNEGSSRAGHRPYANSRDERCRAGHKEMPARRLLSLLLFFAARARPDGGHRGATHARGRLASHATRVGRSADGGHNR